MTETLSIAATTKVTVIFASPDVLAVEAHYAHDGKKPPKHLWPEDGPARVRWETRPAGRTHDWFCALDAVHRSGRTPGPGEWGRLLTEYRDVFRLAVAPDTVLRPALRALARAGRASRSSP